MKSKLMETQYGIDRYILTCDCTYPDHLLVFDVDKTEGEVDVSVYFAHNWKEPFFMRLKSAFKYLFFRENVCQGDSVIFTQQNIEELEEVIVLIKGTINAK